MKVTERSLGEVDRVWTGQLHAEAQAAGPDAGDQLVGLFDALTSACRQPGYRGCAFLKAAAETAPGTPVHDRTVTHKRAVPVWIQELALYAGATNPDQLAPALTLLLDGGLASGALDADPENPHTGRRSRRDSQVDIPGSIAGPDTTHPSPGLSRASRDNRPGLARGWTEHRYWPVVTRSGIASVWCPGRQPPSVAGCWVVTS